jgi:hypothetical protein
VQAPARKIVQGVEPEPEFVVQRRPERERPPAPRPDAADMTPAAASVPIPPLVKPETTAAAAAVPIVVVPPPVAPVTPAVVAPTDTRRRPPTPADDDEDNDAKHAGARGAAAAFSSADDDDDDVAPIVFKAGRSEPVISPERPAKEDALAQLEGERIPVTPERLPSTSVLSEGMKAQQFEV